MRGHGGRWRSAAFWFYVLCTRGRVSSNWEGTRQVAPTSSQQRMVLSREAEKSMTSSFLRGDPSAGFIVSSLILAVFSDI